MKYDVKTENLTPEEMEQFQELVEKANKPKRKMPTKNEKYYYIDDDGEIYCDEWQSYPVDKNRYELGNYYKTKEKAEYAKEYLETKAALQNYADEHNESELDWTDDSQNKYYICYDFCCCALKSIITCSRKSDEVYFTSKSILWEAVKEIGEERVARFYRGVDMTITLKYKGYTTIIEQDIEDDVLYYHGRIEGIEDLIFWECESVTETESKFQEAVDDYLEFCKSVSKEPNKPEKVEVE